MSNWWKRFFGLENDDDYEEMDHDYIKDSVSHKMSDAVPKARGRFEDPGRRIEVKMVNQFPANPMTRNKYEHKALDANAQKGHLKRNRDFDSLDEPAYLRKSQHHVEYQTRNYKSNDRYDRQETRSSRPQKQVAKEQSESKEKSTKRKVPFRPTTVPSPIFGYQQRRDFQKPVTEPEITLVPEVEEDVFLIHDDGLPLAEERTFLPYQSNDAAMDLETNEVSDGDDFEVESFDSLPLEEEITLEPQELPEEQHVAELHKQNQTLEHKNPAVPYNVLMFGADRHALRKKQQQQNVGLVTQSFPGNQSLNARDNLSNHNDRQKDTRHSESIRTDHPKIEKPESFVDKTGLPIDLFQDPPNDMTDDLDWINEKREVLKQVLKNFHVHADIVSYVQGPTVTRFEIRLHPGVKVSKVIGLTEDIKLSMAAEQIRIAPVAGKSTVGIEIPNEKRKPVYLKTLLHSESFKESTAPLTAALGIDISGKEVVTDLSKMPHGLIAGATGSGKSVCIHSLILSLIYKSDPDQLRLVLIDPKVVELAMYQRLPHLAAPVITQPKDAALALRWAVEEMERRYQAFADVGVRDIKKYNQTVPKEERWPYIVIIIDELADLMMVSPQDVEESICRIAQKARAAGIHLLLATQRPSVDVITGLIKANIPTRIAFGVSAQADSRTILDSGGAERLLGQGDMLFAENGSRDIQRLQGAFVSDDEIDHVTEFLMSWPTLPYLFDPVELREQRQTMDDEDDELYMDAANFVIEQGQASVSSLQRRFRIGYNRAARLIDSLEANDVISEANGSKPRQVLMTKEMFVGNDYE